MYSMHFFLKRKDGLSLDDFYKHWENVHAPLVKRWAEKHGFSYRQIRTQKPTGPAEAAALQAYDGIAVFEYADADTAARAFADPEFIEDVSPDQVYFIQPEATISISGVANTIC